MTQTGVCGCVQHTDATWTLCADCASRIGVYGTCLVCGGAANELWMANDDPDISGCSPECAERAFVESQILNGPSRYYD